MHRQKGHMYSGSFFQRKVKKRNTFSSYICHPSMANNEVSGIVVLNALIKYIQTKIDITAIDFLWLQKLLEVLIL